MKAKAYWHKLAECKTDEELENSIEQMLKDLVKEADDLITQRKAKSNSAIQSCVTKVDGKWKAMIRIHEQKKDTLDDNAPLKASKFFDDGFKAAYVLIHPNREWMFDMEKHKKVVQEAIDWEKEKEKMLENFHLYPVVPYDQLTLENITTEILTCYMALGQYSRYIQAGFMTIEMIEPFALRIHLLKYWKETGKINLDDVPEFEKDRRAWINSHPLPSGSI